MPGPIEYSISPITEACLYGTVFTAGVLGFVWLRSYLSQFSRMPSERQLKKMDKQHMKDVGQKLTDIETFIQAMGGQVPNKVLEDHEKLIEEATRIGIR